MSLFPLTIPIFRSKLGYKFRGGSNLKTAACGYKRRKIKIKKIGGSEEMKVMNSRTARIVGPDEKSYRILSINEIEEGEEIRLRLKSEKEIYIKIEGGNFIIEGNSFSIMKIKGV